MQGGLIRLEIPLTLRSGLLITGAEFHIDFQSAITWTLVTLTLY